MFGVRRQLRGVNLYRRVQAAARADESGIVNECMQAAARAGADVLFLC
jgi:hypothetical protein